MEEQAKDFKLVEGQEMIFQIVCDGSFQDVGLLAPDGCFVSFDQMCKELASLEGFELHLKLRG